MPDQLPLGVVVRGPEVGVGESVVGVLAYIDPYQAWVNDGRGECAVATADLQRVPDAELTHAQYVLFRNIRREYQDGRGVPARKLLQRAVCTSCGCTFYIEERWIGLAREQSYTKQLNCPIGCNVGSDPDPDDPHSGSTIRLENP